MQLMINTILVIFEKCAKLHIFQISLVVLIINRTPSLVITYTFIALTFILQWIIAEWCFMWLLYIIFGAPPYLSLIFW